MKFILILSITLAIASAALNRNPPRYNAIPQKPKAVFRPAVSTYQSNQNEIPILRHDSNIDPITGQYSFSYETGNGIQMSENGVAGQQVQGSAAWTSPEGEPIQLQYVADENGYQAYGSAIPTSPPIPEAILKALEYIRTHPPHQDTLLQSQPQAQTQVYRTQPTKFIQTSRASAFSGFQKQKQRKY